MPFDSGLTSVIKGHGHQGPGDIEFQMYSTGKSGILWIRNPYHAIYGYRHFLFMISSVTLMFHISLESVNEKNILNCLNMEVPINSLLELGKMYGIDQELEYFFKIGIGLYIQQFDCGRSFI